MRRRGFTLLEVVFVLVLIGAITIAIVPRLTSGRSASTDRAAEGSLDAAVEATISARSANGRLTADPVYLSAFATDLTFTSSPSSAETIVSAYQTPPGGSPPPTVIGYAALGGDSRCYLLRRDFNAQSGAPLSVYAFTSPGSTTPCSGQSALALTLDTSSTPPRGTSWSQARTIP